MSGQTEIMWGDAVVLDEPTDLSSWKEYKLKELTAKIGSGATPRGGSNVYKESGISLIRSQNVLDFKFSDAGLAFIDEEQAHELRNVAVQENDILLNITGDSVARCCIVAKEYLPARVNQHVAIIRPYEHKADYKFVFYYLQYLKPELLIGAEVGATRNAITKATIEEIDILLPSLPEQRAIADVLNSLDDKIDMLHRQNATLESLAETLFQQWFVDGAKEEWKEGNLGDLFTLQRGFDLPIQNRVPGEFPIITSSGYSTGHHEYKVVGPGVVTGRSGQIGQVHFVMEKFWPLNTSLFIKEFKIGTPVFTYFTLKYTELDRFNVGSSVPMLNRNHVHAHVAPIPPKELIDKFEDIAYPHFEKMHKNTTQIRTLSNLRDTLLPKLMSGEVRMAY